MKSTMHISHPLDRPSLLEGQIHGVMVLLRSSWLIQGLEVGEFVGKRFTTSVGKHPRIFTTWINQVSLMERTI
jgi:hypothetical protein